MSAIKLLFVDDDLGLRAALGAVLRREGFEVTDVGTVPEALELINNQEFDVLLSDLNIGEPGDGFTVVSAMRRVQPTACTFILTGYPDLESAIQAIRSQVDDYFSKPLRVGALVEAISSLRNGKRPLPKSLPPRKVSRMLREATQLICERWLQEVLKNPEMAAIPVTDEGRRDHIPALVKHLIRRLEEPLDKLSPEAAEAARKHGRRRYQQGYTIAQMVFEARALQRTLSSMIQENLFGIDFSTLIHDILQMGESMHAALEISIRSYQSQILPSLQTSFSLLYRSPFLGVAIADESRIIDANDAFLRMVGYSREDLTMGNIDWRQMTPEKYRPLDVVAIEQLRQFGTSVPFEKEYILADGFSLPFLIGAVRLSVEPLEWSGYVIDLTEQRKVLAAEQKLREWETRHKLINHLAHELNNPLAAMTFTVHLLSTHPGIPPDACRLLEDVNEMLERMSSTVKKVLAEMQQ